MCMNLFVWSVLEQQAVASRYELSRLRGTSIEEDENRVAGKQDTLHLSHVTREDGRYLLTILSNEHKESDSLGTWLYSVRGTEHE